MRLVSELIGEFEFGRHRMICCAAAAAAAVGAVWATESTAVNIIGSISPVRLGVDMPSTATISAMDELAARAQLQVMRAYKM